MSEGRQAARVAAERVYWDQVRERWRPAGLQHAGLLVTRHAHAFDAGFDAGAEWQAEQDAGTIDGLKQDREFAYRSRMQFWEENQRLRAALEACAAALEDAGPCWDAGGSSRCYAHGGNDWPCPAAAAITQARAALDQEAGA